MKNYFLMGLLFLYTGCTNSKTKLEYALHSARENRPEIEKVIGHYAYGTLLYKSAVFLVENTTFRLSYAGELIDIYRDSVGQWNGKADLNGIWNKIAAG
ncbi:MAG: hypothetical protein LUD68_06700 [Rikenellaceae bacterium]|nr:hypothetical protein [Rikenellaceae bacterium]